MSFHKDLNQTSGIHIPFNWIWADATALAAETVTADDLYKIGWQEDVATAYILTAVTPTWEVFGGGSGGSVTAHTVEDAVTNAITDVVELQHNSTGTPATGFGAGIAFQAETDTTENRGVGQIGFAWSDATDATRTSQMLLYGYAQANKTLIGAFQSSDTQAVAPNALGAGSIDLQSYRTLATQTATGDNSFAVGQQNTVISDDSVVIGGYQNVVENGNGGTYGYYGGNAIIGGIRNVISYGGGYKAVGSAILGGIYNYVAFNNDGEYSGIVAGGFNKISSRYGFIGGGRANVIKYGYSAFSHGGAIVGGSNNLIIGSKYGFIGSGKNNNLQNSIYSSIGGGKVHFSLYSDYSFIGGGKSNAVRRSGYGVVLGGKANQVGALVTTYGANYSVIGGGENHIIHNTTGNITHSGVFAGYKNIVRTNYSIIAGGSTNTIYNSSNFGFIGGGTGNIVNTASYGVVAGGRTNSVSLGHGFVGGGFSNIINIAGYYGAIAGGSQNTVAKNFGAIPGGLQGRAKRYGELAHASGRFASNGDAQGVLQLVARRTVTHNTTNWYELFLDGAGASERITLESDQTLTFEILLVGNVTGGGSAFSYIINGCIENDGGTTTLLASNITTVYEADANFAARVSADDPNDALLIEVSDAGPSSVTVRWVATIRTVEVIYN